MKRPMVTLGIAAAVLPVLLSAATYTVRVNPDGSFSPSRVQIASGDTVEWTLSGAGDSIIPVNWDGISNGVCSAVRPFSAGDPNSGRNCRHRRFR